MAFGLGTTQFWYGSSEQSRKVFHDALFSYGINVIDTAEMYGSGRCEQEVARILRANGRNRYYIIDKILPENVTEKGFMRSLKRSLSHLETDCIDLYLLHWRENCDLHLLVDKMEQAVSEGLIRNWGVSNFDVSDMEDLLKVENGERCLANEVFYNIFHRGIEYDLLPYLKQHGIMPISYSTLDTRSVRRSLTANQGINALLQQDQISPEALMLAFAARNRDLLALFNTSSTDHLRDNLKCRHVDIDKYMPLIDEYFPAPDHKIPLEKR